MRRTIFYRRGLQIFFLLLTIYIGSLVFQYPPPAKVLADPRFEYISDTDILKPEPVIKQYDNLIIEEDKPTPKPIEKKIQVPKPPVPPAKVWLFTKPLPKWCGIITTRFSSKHKAIDLAQGGGCQELADAGGVVITSGFVSGGCGYIIVIDHKNGWTSTYCHGNGTQYVKNGAVVYQGQPVQYMGMSGDATGVHLHYVLKHNGIEVNPIGLVLGL